MIERMRELCEKAFAKKASARKYALVAIALILVVIFCISYAKKTLHAEHPLPAYVALKCAKCGHAEDRRVYSIDDRGLECSLCKGRLGYRLKCNDCDFEFPFFPLSYDTVDCIKGQKRREAIVMLLNQRMCPNCGGPRTINVEPSKHDDDPKK